MLLTIAIPTYDRNSRLEENLQNLLPQLTEDCELLVIDNSSPTPVADTLARTLSMWSGFACRVIRNRVNIGGAANIMRCFELCAGEWLWCLGDDDTIAKDAIKNIIADIRRLPDATLLHYSTSVDQHLENITIRGTDDFIKGPISFNGMMFTPACIYNIERTISSLRFGYLYAYSWGPHLAVAISSLANYGICEIRSYRLIVSNIGVGKENMWAPIGYLAGRQALLELSMSDAARTALARKMDHCPSIEYIACEMIIRASGQKDSLEALFLYDQIAARNRPFRKSIVSGLKWRAYHYLVKWPCLGLRLIRLIYRIFSKVSYFQRNQLEKFGTRDRFYRA